MSRTLATTLDLWTWQSRGAVRLHHRKFLSMGDDHLGFKIFSLNETLDATPLDASRGWERFLVMDATDDKIAPHNPFYVCYVRKVWQGS